MNSLDEPPTNEPRRRVVLLGASNLTRGISTAVETAQIIWNEPLSVLVAAGHGRSYGMTTSVMGRKLPGILECGLWRDLAAAPPGPTAVLLTDIGNDLIYGSSVETIYRWVETCLDRLSESNATAIMTGLPLEGLKSRPRWQFNVLKQLFFPSRELRFEAVIERAYQLDERMEQLAKERNISRIVPQRAWYGWDPIHIKMRYWGVAWQKILSPWSNSENFFPLAQGSLRRWIYLRKLRPAERVFWGHTQLQTQPSGRLRGGTTVAWY
jgi:hypothetical protein